MEIQPGAKEAMEALRIDDPATFAMILKIKTKALNKEVKVVNKI